MQRLTTNSLLIAAAVTALSGVYANAAVTIYGGPSYDGTIGGASTSNGSAGFQETVATPSPVNTTGAAAGTSTTSGAGLGNGYIYYNTTNSGKAPTAETNDAAAYVITPTGPVRLNNPNLNTPTVATNASVAAVPGAVTANAINGNYVVGQATTAFTKTFGSQSTAGAVWNATTGAITFLPVLSTYTTAATANSYAGTYSSNNPATAVNDTGIVAGTNVRYGTPNDGTVQLGSRPVRWDPNGSGGYTITELAISGVSASGSAGGTANAINHSGAIAGGLDTYNTTSTPFLGHRATYWVAGSTNSTPVTLLQSLNVNTTGYADQASVMNDAGVIGGKSATNSTGTFAVRWASSTATPEKLLPIMLGTTTASNPSAGYVLGINTNGDVVGQTEAYNAAGTQVASSQGALWKFGTSTPIALSLTDDTAKTYQTGKAVAVNDSDISVGQLSSTFPTVNSATLWTADGTAYSLFNMLSASDRATASVGGWTSLIIATGITNDGYVSGYGTYDADGTSGSLAAYQRGFLIAVPEPTSALAISAFGLMALRRRRANSSN